MAQPESLSDQLITYAIIKDRTKEKLKEKNCGVVINSFHLADRIISDAIRQAQSVVNEINYATDNAIDSVKDKHE